MGRSETARRIRIGDFEIVLEPGLPGEIFPGRTATFGVVHAALMRHLGDAWAVAELRHAVIEADMGAERLDDIGILAWVATQIEMGRWQLESRVVEHPPIDPIEVMDLADLLPSTDDEPPDEPPLEGTHHVEIALVGEDDAPIPGERYRIVLPDGTVVQGHTDAQGAARIDDIVGAGKCKVSFPDLDADAWEPA